VHLRNRLVVERSTVPEGELTLVISCKTSSSVRCPLLLVASTNQLALTTRVGDLSLLMDVCIKWSHIDVAGFSLCAAGGSSWCERDTRPNLPRPDQTDLDVSPALAHAVHVSLTSAISLISTRLTCLHLSTPPIKSTVFLGLYFLARSPGCRVMAAWYAACSKTSSLSGLFGSAYRVGRHVSGPLEGPAIADIVDEG